SKDTKYHLFALPPVMSKDESTCWTEIQGAAAGNPADRDRFARRYGAFIRACLGARWRNSCHRQELGDATQEVFVECLKQNGVLQCADPTRGDFRAFLVGVIWNVAKRVEAGRPREHECQPPSGFMLEDVAESEAHLSQVVDQN